MLTVLFCCAVCLLLCREFGCVCVCVCVVGESIPVATQGVAVKAREIGRNDDAENEEGKEGKRPWSRQISEIERERVEREREEH